MSIQVSYKKQFLVFLIIFALILSSAELIIRIYDVGFFCKFESSPLFSNFDFLSKRQICSDYRSLQYDGSQLPRRLHNWVLQHCWKHSRSFQIQC